MAHGFSKRASAVAIACLMGMTMLPANMVSAKGLSCPKGVMANAVGNSVTVSWEPVKRAKKYYVYEKSEQNPNYQLVSVTKGRRIKLNGRTAGVDYSYQVSAAKGDAQAVSSLSVPSKEVTTTIPMNGARSTITNFLRNGVRPIGGVMYVYGGGWGVMETRTIGISPAWRKFASRFGKRYNRHRYQFHSHKGLDCTGFVGFTTYNTLENHSGGRSYVYKSFIIGRRYQAMHLGRVTRRNRIQVHKAGDVMFGGSGHAWISMGQCPDGSTVVLHSQKYGVRLCGTPSRSGKSNSQAAKLAKTYMKRYYGSWYRKYHAVTVPSSYNRRYDQFTWSSSVLSDPDGLQKMSADQVLKVVFGEN